MPEHDFRCQRHYLELVPGTPHPNVVFGLHLINEITTATQLLAVGLNQVVEPRWHAAEPASAFTCMSSGVERILKLTYGLAILHDGQSFPSEKDLRRLGHDLVSLDGIVRPRLVDSASTLDEAYIANLLTNVSQDPYWPGLLNTLNVWAGAAGRYRDLTILSGKAAEVDPAEAVWNATELKCLIDLDLMTAVAGPENHTALVQARTRLALSVLRWWHAIFRSWTHGLLGTERKSPGTALSPAENRYLAPPLVALVKPL